MLERTKKCFGGKAHKHGTKCLVWTLKPDIFIILNGHNFTNYSPIDKYGKQKQDQSSFHLKKNKKKKNLKEDLQFDTTFPVE
jgi:hypothetical protein